MPPSSPIDDFLGMRQGALWRRRLQWLIAGLALVALVILIGRFVNGGEVTRYATVPVERSDLQPTASGSGALQPADTRPLEAAVSGVVAEVMVKAGDRVSAGQVLARLDSAALAEAAAQASSLADAREAALVKAVAIERSLREQLARFERVRKQSHGQVPSDREMTQARDDLRTASASVADLQDEVVAGRQALAQRQADIDAAEIRAPADGVVVRRLISPGQTVAAHDQTLFDIAAPTNRLRLEIVVDQAQAEALGPGAAATISVAGQPPAAGTLAGSRRDVAAAPSRAVLTIDVRNPDQALRPGMTATATLPLGPRQSALLAPAAALTFAQASDARQGRSVGGQAIYVVGDQGAPRRIPVTVTGGDGQKVAVSGPGLQPGMPVIVGLR